MTLEELADLSADALSKLKTEELEAILKPFFTVTRPELVVRQVKKIETYREQVYISPQKQAALDLLKAQGVDVDELMKGRKKK